MFDFMVWAEFLRLQNQCGPFSTTMVPTRGARASASFRLQHYLPIGTGKLGNCGGVRLLSQTMFLGGMVLDGHAWAFMLAH